MPDVSRLAARLFLAVALVVGLPAPADGTTAARMPTTWQGDPRWTGAERLAHATRARRAVVEQLHAAAGITFPPAELLLRIYKAERELEVWAGDGDGPLRRVATYGICAASGELGPKRAEGDLQVPEGFYELGWFNPQSAFHLSALIDYPNRSDRLRGGAAPGGQIMLHGGCASVGCVAMTDERMEELYLMAWSTWRRGGHRTQVHMFPARDIDALLEDRDRAEHHAFWREIQIGHDLFEATRRLPAVTIGADGAYAFTAR